MARALFADSRPGAASLYSSSAATVLAELPAGSHDVVVKSHTLDTDMFAMMRLADVRILRSMRDPRDAIASLMERFALPYHEALAAMTASLASIVSVPDAATTLDLVYEDGFTRDADTVARIARFLDLSVSDETCAEIFRSLDLESVRRMSLAVAEAAGSDVTPQHFDPATHWHPGHVRDGAIGNWQATLDPVLADVAAHAVAERTTDGFATIHWPAILFFNADAQYLENDGIATLPGSERFAVWGPRLHLPAGRWRAEVKVRTLRPDDRLNVGLDVIELASEVVPIAMKIIGLSNDDQCFAIEFDHIEHVHQIEIRLREMGRSQAGRIAFGGVTLTRLSDSKMVRTVEARLV